MRNCAKINHLLGHSQNKLFGWVLTKLGAFPVNRGKSDMTLIEDSAAIINSGKHLVIFPEGTRSKDGKIGRGKTGVARIAIKSGVDILPCGIIFEGEKLRFRSKLTLRIGKAIHTTEIAGDNPSPQALKEVKKRTMDAITELVEKE